MFKPNCTFCHKRLQTNDSTIKFGRSNIWHESCYREHLNINIQNAGLREITLLRKVRKSLSRIRSRILSVNSKDFDVGNFLKNFDNNIISLKSITDTTKGLNIIQKKGIRKNLEHIFQKMEKLVSFSNNFLEEYTFSKTELTLEQYKEDNIEFLEGLKEKWIELADSLMDVHNKLKLSENKNQSKIREEIQKRIDEIPKRDKKF